MCYFLYYISGIYSQTYKKLEMDDLSQQVEEIEALVAIYGQDWQTDDEENRAYSIMIGEGEAMVKLYIKLPNNYPSTVSPIFELSAPHFSLAQKTYISNLLDEVCVTNVGQNVIFQLVEKVREVAHSDCKVHPDSDTEKQLCTEEPKASVLTGNENDTYKDCDSPDIVHGDAFMDRKSYFQGHAASVTSMNQVKQVLHNLYENKKIKQATHNMYAYRIYREDTNVFIQDCEDDGESQAGGRLLHLLQIMNVRNVIVVVSRWYGGIHLGPDRFRHINNAARQVLVAANLIPEKNKKKFTEEYASAIKLYTEDFDYPKEIHQIPSLKMLLTFAEKEFLKEFSTIPTYAACAPGCINFFGEKTDFNEGKVLSMATQLVTIIVGTRRTRSRWCKIKTLTRELDEKCYAEFCISTSGLDTCGENSWVNYIKAVIRSFSIPKDQIPGFKALIISSIPMKCGLGSSSALTVATYTFLEALTNVHVHNTLEKSIACKQAEKISTNLPSSLSDTMISVVGIVGQLIEFDPRTLQIQGHEWKAVDVDLILINSNQKTIDTRLYQKYLNQSREVAFALNLISLRDATVQQLVTIEQLFSAKLIEKVYHIVGETNKVTKAVQCLKQSDWKKLGMVMWESHCSMRDNFGLSCVHIEYIMEAIQNIHGLYGARIVGRGCGGFVLVMVQRKAVKEMVVALSRVAECREYQVVKPSSGARILYTDGSSWPSQFNIELQNTKKARRYHLSMGDYDNYEQHRNTIYGVRNLKSFTPLKAISIKDC